jgi:hypothetical protein
MKTLRVRRTRTLHPAARRAAEICAAGGHHVLLLGPPGVGNTMLSRLLMLNCLDVVRGARELLRCCPGSAVPRIWRPCGPGPQRS